MADEQQPNIPGSTLASATVDIHDPNFGAPPPKKEPMFVIAYCLTLLSGICVYFIADNDNMRLKFHAVQSVYLGIVSFIFGVLIGIFIAPLSFLIFTILWIYGIYIGYIAYSTNKDMDIPFIGEYSRQMINKQKSPPPANPPTTPPAA